MLYEMRIYYILPGRMDAIHKRFSNYTIELFQKYDIKTIDFWEDANGKEIIYYIVEHKDRESRDSNFEKFTKDTEWLEVKRISELDGPIVEKIESIFMSRVPYSPMK